MNIREISLPYESFDLQGNEDSLNMEFRNNVSKLFEETEYRIYPELGKEIKPEIGSRSSWKAIICDLCQKAPATEEFPINEPTEYLCKGCNELRKKAPRYNKLAEWEEQTGNTKIALLEISLNIGSLLNILSVSFNRQFNKELSEKKIENISPQDFGFSIIFEFLEDYQNFLSEVKNEITILRSFKDKRKGLEIAVVLNNLFITKIENLKNLMLIAEMYAKIYKKYFNKFLEHKQSPVFLSISCANIKYPFFEHWRFLDEYKTRDKRFSIFISVAGKGSIETEIWNMENVIQFYKEVSRRGNTRALHKLSEIAKFSETLADKIMHDRKIDKSDYASHITYKELTDPTRPHGLDHRSLLTLAKIIGD